MNNVNTTPPREVLSELPDYFLGCLIFYEQADDNTMNWICYDGRTKYRCSTRAAAEKCAKQLWGQITDEQLGHLLSAHHFMTRAWKALDKAATESDVEMRLWLELKAVEVRKLSDAIDTLVSKKLKHTDNL